MTTQQELFPRDYSKGLTDDEQKLLDSIRRAGFELMTAVMENTRSGQRWQSKRAIRRKSA